MKSSLYHEYLGKFVQVDNQKYRQIIFKYLTRNVDIAQIYAALEDAFAATERSQLVLVVSYEYQATNPGKLSQANNKECLIHLNGSKSIEKTLHWQLVVKGTETRSYLFTSFYFTWF